MITVYLWNKAQNRGSWLPNLDLLRTATAQSLPPEDVLWIDLENPSAEEEALAFEHFLHVHILTLQDITLLRHKDKAMPHFPKAEEFPDYLFVVVNPLSNHFAE